MSASTGRPVNIERAFPGADSFVDEKAGIALPRIVTELAKLLDERQEVQRQ